MTGAGGFVGEVHDDAGGGREQFGPGANQRHGHGAAVRQSGDIDPLRIGAAVGDMLFDQANDEGDVVGAGGRRPARALGVRPQIGPGAVEPVGIDHAKPFAAGDQRPRGPCPHVGARLGIAVKHDHQRRRPCLGKLAEVAACHAGDVDGLRTRRVGAEHHGDAKGEGADHASSITALLQLRQSMAQDCPSAGTMCPDNPDTRTGISRRARRDASCPAMTER